MRQQTKTEKVIERVAKKVTNGLNPYSKVQMGVFLAVVTIAAGAAGYYGLRTEKVEKKK